MVWRPTSAEVGQQVTLRLRTPVGPITAVGELLAVDAGRLRLRRRDGSLVDAALDDIEAGRLVAAPPSTRVSDDDLERIAALGWRARITEPLGDWLLRADEGQSRRASSALAVGDPGLPASAVAAQIERWYAARGLPPRVQAAADGPAHERLVSAGWRPERPAMAVMTAEVSHVLRAAGASAKTLGADLRSTTSELDSVGGYAVQPPPESNIEVADAPDDAWLALWRPDGVSPELLALLTRHPATAYLSLRMADGRVVAGARVVVDGRWLGLFAVTVDPTWRRRGFARAITVAAIRAGGRMGGRHAYLQVASINQPALDLYAGMGFRRHHDYGVLTP